MVLAQTGLCFLLLPQKREATCNPSGFIQNVSVDGLLKSWYSLQIWTFHVIHSKKSSFVLHPTLLIWEWVRDIIFVYRSAPFMQFLAKKFGELKSYYHSGMSYKHFFLCRSGHFVQFLAKKCFGIWTPPTIPCPYQKEGDWNVHVCTGLWETLPSPLCIGALLSPHFMCKAPSV